MTELPPLRPSSETTGFQQIGTLPSLIGSPRGAIGVGKKLSESNALCLLKPEETDKRLGACLEAISKQPISFEMQTMIPVEGPTYRIVKRISWPCPSSVFDEVRKAIDGAFRSAPEDKLAAALMRLRMLTRGRAQGGDDDRMAEGVAWIEQLQCWPGDVALEVIRDWPSRSQWWPTWAEVRQQIEAKCSKRMAVAQHFNALMAGRVPPMEPQALPEPRKTVEELKAAYGGDGWGIPQGFAGEVAKTAEQVKADAIADLVRLEATKDIPIVASPTLRAKLAETRE